MIYFCNSGFVSVIYFLGHVLDPMSDVRVLIKRRPSLQLESGRIFEMGELVFYLPEKKTVSI